jgi:signal transduction histidine kinase
VRLGRNEHGRLLLVDDDGAGFDPTLVAATSAGFGLTSMRERAQALPGDLTIDSRPGVGTTVRLQW